MIRLLLADDQELIRRALAVLLALEEDFEVVAAVGRGDEVLDAAIAKAGARNRAEAVRTADERGWL